MGGYGSTRWNGEHTRQTTDALLWLDVRRLARRGYLSAAPGSVTTATVSWSTGGGAPAWIVVRHDGDDPDALVLDYRTRTPGEEWEPVRERIPLARTPCPYGGSRPWFRCPGCSARRAVLYCVEGRFRCRICHDLAYGSTRETSWQRSRRRAERIRARLGGETGGFLPPFPDKPRNMRWRTYNHLAARLEEAELTARAGREARGDELITHLERTNGKGQ